MASRALLSVSDKSGLIEFARGLSELGYELLSTGGTAAALREAGLAVSDVSEVTGFPECLDGRVKTLHPRIHAGILAERNQEQHMQFLKKENIAPIDIVVVNLYPFRETIRKPDCDLDTATENIDIGGPGMLRAAAKNYQSVTVITDTKDYGPVLSELRSAGKTSESRRLELAKKVFSLTASYDALIAEYLLEQTNSPEPDTGSVANDSKTYPEQYTATFEKSQDLRYGENNHQTAAFYRLSRPTTGSLTAAKQLHGKALSYNNISDADAALAMIKEFNDQATAVAVKHANPCGIASRGHIDEAWDKAFEADPVSIFGGIVAVNRTVTKYMAEKMSGIFLEVILAPAFEEEALEILTQKKNIRLLELDSISVPYPSGTKSLKSVFGGLLIQEADTALLSQSDFKTVTKKGASEADLADAVFGMKVVKHIKSNAVCLVKDRQTVGVGPGQVNRITALEIAIAQAGDKAKGSILASDAFFPFDDCVKTAAAAGVSLIVQPGGSLRDEDSIKACDEAGIPMLFSGQRHFRH